MTMPNELPHPEANETPQAKTDIRAVVCMVGYILAASVAGGTAIGAVGGAVYAIRSDAKAEAYADMGDSETAQQYLAKRTDHIAQSVTTGLAAITIGGLLAAKLMGRREDEPHPDAPSAASIPANLPLE